MFLSLALSSYRTMLYDSSLLTWFVFLHESTSHYLYLEFVHWGLRDETRDENRGGTMLQFKVETGCMAMNDILSMWIRVTLAHRYGNWPLS